MKIAVKDLRPNPFRHLERYPISREKVDALKRSIKDTEFWDNLVVRKSLNGGGYEMAYGHHRFVALKELHVAEIDVPVRKLDDTAMAKIMAHENMEEWAWSAAIGQETVRSIVEAFGEGKIELPSVGRVDGAVRYAPSFVTVGKTASGRQEAVYTAATLAKFLGWNESQVEAHLNALGVIEKGLADESDFEGLTAYQAEAVARQGRRVEKVTGKSSVAKAVVKKLASGMRSSTGRPGRGGKKESGMQSVTLHSARHVADQEIARHTGTKTKTLPPAGKAIPALATQLIDVPSKQTIAKIEAVIAVRKILQEDYPKDLRMLIGALRGVAKRFSALADKLES